MGSPLQKINVSMTITFLFPNSGSQLSGGLKVVCEYANRLAADGYNVHIAYAGSIFWNKKTSFYKLTGIVRYIQNWCKDYSCRSWFVLDKRVKEHWCWSLNERHVPHSDIYICTSPYTAMYLKDYTIGKKFYLIQDYENWGNITDSELRDTYHYPFHKIVISHWLKAIMDEEHEQCTLVPNGFHPEDFIMQTPIRSKNSHCITMLYHTMSRKDCTMGFQALDIVYGKYPQLHVNIFGTAERPSMLPNWYNYRQMPTKQELNHLYDEAAIFIGTSKIEGWGLTVGEAMFCGCAVACTDILGYREMATDNKTALLSPVGDARAMAANIIRLIEDDALRYRIAEAGHKNIQQFTWDKSYALLKQVLTE